MTGNACDAVTTRYPWTWRQKVQMLQCNAHRHQIATLFTVFERQKFNYAKNCVATNCRPMSRCATINTKTAVPMYFSWAARARVCLFIFMSNFLSTEIEQLSDVSASSSMIHEVGFVCATMSQWVSGELQQHKFLSASMKMSTWTTVLIHGNISTQFHCQHWRIVLIRGPVDFVFFSSFFSLQPMYCRCMAHVRVFIKIESHFSIKRPETIF